jgi:hypothetical protein
VNTLDQVFQAFPPRYASQVFGSPRWYFMLEDGRLIGGEEGITHRLILGIKDDDPEVDSHHDREVEFCREHHALRLAIGPALSVEIFRVAPNEAQLSAIGTLFGSTGRKRMVWDIWLENNESNHPWRHGLGSLAKFRRSLDRITRSTAKKIRPRRQGKKS